MFRFASRSLALFERRSFSTSKFSNIIVTGKSGAGKQPRIDILLEKTGLPQLSTGNIFREYIGKYNKSGYTGGTDRFWDSDKDNFVSDADIASGLKTEGVSEQDIDSVTLGLKAMHFVGNGKFVPDSVTNQLFQAFFAKMNYSAILDGYPRTPEQADYLFDLLDKQNTKVDFYMTVDNTDDRIVARTIGRRICPNPACGKVYHTEFKPAAADGTCKKCGTAVIHRSDDTEPKILSRLEEFKEKCVPMMGKLNAANIPNAVVTGHLEVFTNEAVEKSVIESLTSINVDITK